MADMDIVGKIAKLKKMADGAKAIGSDEEAQAFATMMQTLLAKHKLSMTDVEFELFKEDNPVDHFYIDYGKYPDVEVKKMRQSWSERLARIVGQAHNVRHVVERGTSKLSLIGRRHEVMQCEFVYIVLVRYVQRASWQARHDYYHSHITGWKKRGESVPAKMLGYRDNWIMSFVNRLAERYDEEAKRLAYEVGKNSTAMVRVSDLKTVDDWIDGAKTKGKLSNAKSLGPVARTPHADGFRHGREAADRVRLRSNAVDDGDAPTKHLGAGTKCFACDRALDGEPMWAVTTDGQIVTLGPDCFAFIRPSKTWQPKMGGPKLKHLPKTLTDAQWKQVRAGAATLAEVVGRRPK